MSVIDKLKGIQDVRQNKYSQALQKSPVELAEKAVSAQTPPPVEIQSQSSTQIRLLKAALALLVVLILQASFIIVVLLRNPSVEQKKEVQPKLIEPIPETEIKVSTPARTTTATTGSATIPKSSKTTKSLFKKR